jgi:hypothetical protein
MLKKKQPAKRKSNKVKVKKSEPKPEIKPKYSVCSGTKREEVKGEKPSHYIDKEKLLAEIIASQNANRVSDALSEMFSKIIEGVSHRFPNLMYYGITEDVKQDCHLLLIQKFKNFKAKKNTSCFAYFTTVVYNQMRYQLTKAKKYKEKKDFMVNSVIDYLESNGSYLLDKDDSDDMN